MSKYSSSIHDVTKFKIITSLYWLWGGLLGLYSWKWHSFFTLFQCPRFCVPTPLLSNDEMWYIR